MCSLHHNDEFQGLPNGFRVSWIPVVQAFRRYYNDEDFIHALNFSILIAKQYIYYERLTNENKIDLLSYLPILIQQRYVGVLASNSEIILSFWISQIGQGKIN